ncbi:MAG: hypothetical protein J0H62_00710 [Rhizobiales bacterium]|nr:hypothetical protein [Hyphomicrobiales bacterium]
MAICVVKSQADNFYVAIASSAADAPESLVAAARSRCPPASLRAVYLIDQLNRTDWDNALMQLGAQFTSDVEIAWLQSPSNSGSGPACYALPAGLRSDNTVAQQIALDQFIKDILRHMVRTRLDQQIRNATVETYVNRVKTSDRQQKAVLDFIRG